MSWQWKRLCCARIELRWIEGVVFITGRRVFRWAVAEWSARVSFHGVFSD